MHDYTSEIAVAEFGDTRIARSRAWEMFYTLAEEALGLSRSQANLHLNLYRRFLQHNGALTKLNTGELMILRRSDYTEEEVDAVIEYKENDPTYQRKNIREFVERFRRQQEEVVDVQTKLDIATAELASTVSDNADKDYEIRRLNTEISRLTTERDADRGALGQAREELTRQNSSYSRLLMQIDDLEREKRELQERMAFSKTHSRPETVEVEVVPPGYASLEDALVAKNEEIAAAKAQLNDILAQRQQIESEIAERSTLLDKRTRAATHLPSWYPNSNKSCRHSHQRNSPRRWSGTFPNFARLWRYSTALSPVCTLTSGRRWMPNQSNENMQQRSPTAEFERLQLTRMTCDRIRSANYHLTDHLAELLGVHPELEQILHIGKASVDKFRKAEATQRDLMGTPFLVVVPTLSDVQDWRCLIENTTTTLAVDALRSQLPAWSSDDRLRLFYNNRHYIWLMVELLHVSVLAAPLLGINKELAEFLRSLPQHVLDMAIARVDFPIFRWRLDSKLFWIDFDSKRLGPDSNGHHFLASTPLRADRMDSKHSWTNLRLEPMQKKSTVK
ncbi:hypothetical protein AU476_06190 [Cupriavidus sp. UYMSc13B]|nr:hypothetical protein AU476_06190 [Cupriavidus sp. UYMSc13B]